MKKRIAGIIMIVSLFAAFSPPVATAQEEYSARQVLDEINLARTEPLKFAGFLRELRGRFHGKAYQMPGSTTLIQTIEGVAAVDEAILFLSHQKPLPPLTWSPKLAAAAADLVREQNQTGTAGHNDVSSMDIQEQIERHGTAEGLVGESIAYGPGTPRVLVMRLLIDDGIRDRDHRKNQADPDFDSAGVACGPHPRFGSMCVIDFSGGLWDQLHQKKRPI